MMSPLLKAKLKFLERREKTFSHCLNDWSRRCRPRAAIVSACESHM
jgi:hypothetical protein